MTLKELIEEKEFGMQSKGASYKEYYAAMMKKFDLDTKTPLFKLSKEQRKEVDAGWTSKEEKKGK